MQEKSNIGRDIAYSFGNFSGGIINITMTSWFVFFYIDTLGIRQDLYGWAMLIYALWNAINDPAMGILSDKTKSRWGRRKPYMMFGALPLGLSLVMIFSPLDAVLGSEIALFVYFVVAICIYDTFFSMTMLCWSAALPEMYLEEKNRARVHVFSQISGVLGAIIATVSVQPIINIFGFRVMAIIMATIGVLTMWLSAWGVRERGDSSAKKSLSVWQSFKVTFTNKSFIVCVSAVMLVEVGKVICISTMAFYSKYVMKHDLGVTIIMGIMFVSSMIFAPFISIFCRKFGSKNTYIISVAIFAIGAVGYFWAPNIIYASVVSAIVGFGVSGVMITPNMLYAQIIDEDQVKTGVRREGTFYGMNALVLRLSLILQGAITAWVLGGFGYIATQETQTELASTGIRILMGLTPLPFAVLAICVLFFYPIDKARLAEVQAKVKEMNAHHTGQTIE